MRMHSHLAESREDADFCRETHGVGPLAYAATQDWIGSDVWFAHLTHADPEGIHILAQAARVSPIAPAATRGSAWASRPYSKCARPAFRLA
jgi:cytosine/adenosine deaminase-related metal-dependent hydrolase